MLTNYFMFHLCIHNYDWSLETSACSNAQQEHYTLILTLAIWTQVDKHSPKVFRACRHASVVVHQSGLEALLGLLQLVPDPFWRPSSQFICFDAGDRWRNGRNCSNITDVICWSYHVKLWWIQRHSIHLYETGILSTFGIRGWDILSTGILSWIHKTAHRNLPAYYICLMYVTNPTLKHCFFWKVVTVQMFTLYLWS